MKVIISAGGSGGHIYPALSIIDYLKTKDKDLEVLYIGTHNRMEKDLIPKKGIKYESLEIYGFNKNIKRDLKNIFLIKKAIKKCMNIMDNFKPDIVIGVGGYVTYPVIVAAHKLKIKTLIHEQNSRPGKVNFITSHYADTVCVSFASSIPYLKKAKNIVYTGHPSLDGVRKIKPIDKSAYNLSKDKKLVLYVAGSLGSSSLNKKMIEFLNSKRSNNYEILYVVGSNINIDEFKKNITNLNNLVIVPYIDNLAGIIKNSDLVISRAGAGTLFEIIGSCTPSIIIPSPNVANNHQYYNAKELSDKKLITILEEENITSDALNTKINEILSDSKKYIDYKELKKLENISPLLNIYEEIRKLTCSK